jgi:hypothetical protein
VLNPGRSSSKEQLMSTEDERLRQYFAYGDLGMVGPTGGRVCAHVIRSVNGCKPSDTHYHTLDFQMVYVLKGWARSGLMAI